MDDRVHLHEGETLLCSLRPSAAVLIHGVLRSILESLVLGVVIFIALLFIITLDVALWSAVLVFVLLTIMFSLRRGQHWKSASVRVTTERLLFQYACALPEPKHEKVIHDGPGGFGIADLFFGGSLKTVKWAQYQESEVAERAGVLDVFLRSRTLKIRYGTADAQRELLYNSVPFAHDLKHYLDKVDSAVRNGTVASVRPFVAKPRGKRD
jgi:ABC-type multidrug transport system fused ATPase/permease subunit